MSRFAHQPLLTATSGLRTRPPWQDSLLALFPPPCWGFHFGVLPCLGKRNFTGPRIILSVIEGLELLIPKEGSLCWEKASSEPSDLRVLTNPCSPSLLRAADTGFQAIQGSARDFWGAWLVA